MSDLACTIHVDGDIAREGLVDLVAAAAGGSADGTTVEAPFGEIDVRHNDDFDPEARTAFPDGFLRFAHRVEVYSDQDEEAARAFVARLLPMLWEQGLPAVAAADFEDELPERGGYGRDGLPWPKPR